MTEKEKRRKEFKQFAGEHLRINIREYTNSQRTNIVVELTLVDDDQRTDVIASANFTIPNQ